MITLVAFLAASSSCHTYRPLPLPDLHAGAPGVGHLVRLHMRNGRTVDLRVEELQLPFVHGRGTFGQRLSVDLRDVRAAEHKELSASASWGSVVGISTVVVATLLLLAIFAKKLCPFVYLESDGAVELVGEAYSGAALRSLARGDLLPIPRSPRRGPVHLTIANGADQTQYTDEATLVLVDHPPGTRALSTATAEVRLVGPPTRPRLVRDARGVERTAEVQLVDGRVWQSDLEREIREATPAVHDGVEAVFDPPPGEGPLVLEIHGGNTALLDVAIGRAVAALGDGLASHLAEGNDPASGPALSAWRIREGVDLEVQVAAGGVRRTLGHVPTVGIATMRQVAVDLGSAAEGHPIEVRLSGGTGFWRIDGLTLSRAVAARPTVQRIRAAEAWGDNARDATALLSAADDRHHVLARRGDLVRLRFDIPPVRDGLDRHAFLYSRGYYHLHPRPGRVASPDTVRSLRSTPGSLSRLGLDIYREYRARLLTAAVDR